MSEQDFSDTFAFVEATSCEHLLLYEKWIESTNKWVKEFIHKYGPIQWKENTIGWSQRIGTTHVRFRWSMINGKKICFYEPTSMKVDWESVENFIKQFDKKRYRADNFMSFLSDITK